MDLYAVQETIEQQANIETIQRFNKDLSNKKQTGTRSATYYGHPLLKRAIEPFAENIKNFLKESKKGKAGNNNVTAALLSGVKPELIAFLAAKAIIDRITTRSRLTDVAINIGQAIEDDLKFTSFSTQFPHLFTKVINEASDSRKVRRRNINAAANGYDKSWSSWSKSQKLHVGLKLIDLFIDATNYANIVTKKTNRKNQRRLSTPLRMFVTLSKTMKM